MKIVCDKCGAKYSIADEKVRGKTFKIRCKKCSNVIIVRDKAGAEADAGGDAGEAPADDQAAAAAAAPGWHLAVGGETVGPVPEEDVRARYDRGEIDKETAVWQEGFEDWVPLADVPLFADLPDRSAGGAAAGAAAAGGLAAGLGASAGSDDPFGSGGDDAFAGGGDDAFGSSPEPVASAPAASAPAAEEPQSPRVANLTGARNENSVLFSLDNLQAMAAGSGSSTPASKGPAKVATSAPTSEGSGLIDIRAMGSLMDSGSGGGPDFGGGGGASDDGGVAPLPSFGGGGFGGLSAQPLVTTPPEEEATPAAPPPPPKSNTGLYIVVGILALGLIGLGAFILTRPTPEPQKETVVVKEQVLVPTVSDSDKDDDKDEDEDKDDKEEEADTDGADTDGMEEELGADGKPTGKKKKKKKKSGSTTSSTTGGSDPAPVEEEPKKPTNSADDVDCLLDPSLAKCKGGGSTKKPSGGGGGSVPANAPEKLGPSDLSAGISGVKGAASACASKGGVPPGTKVPIKLSIKGSTGTVISASAQGEYAKTAAATCAAKELKKATFKKFKAAQMGFTYKVKM